MYIKRSFITNQTKNMQTPCKLISGILLAIGGLNWGLVGVGSFFKMNLNLVNLLLGSIPTAENIVYILVGVSAIVHVATCMGSFCCGGECKKK